MENKIRLRYWFKALISSFAISFALIIIVSLLLQLTSLRENKLPILNNIVMVLSISIGSTYLALKLKEKGWLHGLVLGFAYYLIIILINCIVERTILINLMLGIKLFSSSIIGAIGGMIGVNLS